MEVVGGPPAGSGGGVGSELVVSIAILFNGWTRLAPRLDSKFCSADHEGSQKSEVGDEKSEVTGQRAEDGGQKTEMAQSEHR